MNYFAYGSNMSLRRLRDRTPGVQVIDTVRLTHHDLRFHKQGADGSGKCDAHYTGREEHTIHGVLYEIDPREKSTLDRIEGLGVGYDEKVVTVHDAAGAYFEAVTYTATRIEAGLAPFHWYHHHVLTGAREAGLPAAYVDQIAAIAAIEDHDSERSLRELRIYP